MSKLETIKPFSPRKVDALDLLTRAAVVQTYAQANRMSLDHAQATLGQKHPRYADVLTKMVCRAATVPATTLDEGWAQEFVVAEGADLIGTLMPRSAFAQLAGYGLSLTFTIGDILVPDFILTNGGMFVRQGDPIPVIQGITTGQLLTRKKLACIVTYTGEVDEGVIVTLEGLLRYRIQESAGVALDGILLDDLPATDERPAGLLSGLPAITSSGGMQGDLQLLADELFASADHFVRAPVLVMNTAQALAARMQLRSDRDIIPLIISSRMEPGTVAMIDAGDFACAGGRVPRFEVSKEAELHFEDTTPHHLDGSSPVRSLWQEELLGLRMVLEVDWCMRRPGVGSVMRNVHWRVARD